MVQDLIPGLVDRRDLEWDRVQTVRYLIHQRFRYEYPGPIAQLHHRLVIVPPAEHGDQRTVVSHVSVSGAKARTGRRNDEYGNVVVEVEADEVAAEIEFEARIAVDRAGGGGPVAVPASLLEDSRLLAPAGLTDPGRRLRHIAADLRAPGTDDLTLAERINAWVHQALVYRWGVTGVHTTAAEAIRRGEGVCQDYAHVMLALCRLLGLPARYVSGHLLGEGGTHAWVEVLVRCGRGRAAAHGFDPTHGRRAGIEYVTVAVGRDYQDVAPTSGAYVGGPGGRLTTSKRVDIVGFEYA